MASTIWGHLKQHISKGVTEMTTAMPGTLFMCIDTFFIFMDTPLICMDT